MVETSVHDSRMKLEKAYFQLDGGAKVLDFKFNPKEYSISKSAKWKVKEAKGAKQAPPAEFTGSDPRSMTLEIFLDESETGRNVHDDVEKLFECCTPTTKSQGQSKPRPPYVIFGWGNFFSFKAYFESVQAKYTLFRQDGTPIRATCQIKMTEVAGPTPRQNPTSGTLVAHRAHTVSAGDTLASIAYAEYDDPNLWRVIADANDIEDPLRLVPGRRLLLPPASEAAAAR